MLLISLLSLVSFGFGLDTTAVTEDDDQLNILELGPRGMVPDELAEEIYGYSDDNNNNNNNNDDMRTMMMMAKRGVDPMSLPRLIKEPPLKKRSDFESRKRGELVYPSAAKQTVPLVRIREPPLKRGQLFLEDLLQLSSGNNMKRNFLEPYRRLRFGSNRRILPW